MKIFSYFVGAVLSILMFAGIATAAGRNMKWRPYVTHDVNGLNQCTYDDPLGPCYERRITIHNPLKMAVFVKLNCGIEYLTNAEAWIPGRRSVTIVIPTHGFVGGLHKGYCPIYSWKEWRKNKIHYVK